VVQIHPPQPNFSGTYGRSTWGALSTSTTTSTNRTKGASERLHSPPSSCDILTSLDYGPKICPTCPHEAIQRWDIPVAGCQECGMNKSAQDVCSPLLTEQQAASYLTRSVSSLRRDRKNGVGPRFVRLGRSIRYPKVELDVYLSALINPGVRGVPNA